MWLPATRGTKVANVVKGAQTIVSTWAEKEAFLIPVIKATASAMVLYIFQFPAMTGILITSSPHDLSCNVTTNHIEVRFGHRLPMAYTAFFIVEGR
jgi:hypothetical protein